METVQSVQLKPRDAAFVLFTFLSHKLQQEATAQKAVEVERNRLIDGIRKAFAKAGGSIDVSLF